MRRSRIFMPPDKPPFRGCENPPKAFQHFSHQATAIQATAIHRLYRDSVSVAFRTAASREDGWSNRGNCVSVLADMDIKWSGSRRRTRRSTESMVGRPAGSLPVVGNVRDHARLEGNLVNLAQHIAQVLRIAVDLGHPHKRVVGPPRSRRQLTGSGGFNLDEGQSQQDS